MTARKARSLIYIIAMVLMILNAKKATQGASEAIELCIYTVVPALFPFCLLSVKFLEMTSNTPLRIIRPLEIILKLPPGGGTVFLLGLIGGYPAGAICAENTCLNSKQKNHIASFCNNAGPAFIFGIVSELFDLYILIKIWMIQIISAITSGILLNRGFEQRPNTTKPVNSKNRSPVMSMVNVCSTIIFFKAMISCIPSNWITNIPIWIKVYIIGLLELTNGITMLSNINNVVIRYITACGLLSFGGLCVAMQISKISACISIKTYIKGKVIQAIISTLLAIISIYIPIFMTLLPCVLIILIRNKVYAKKSVAFFRRMRYNKKKIRRSNHVVPKETA